MEIKATVVDELGHLIGFRVEGKPKEFNEEALVDELIEKTLSTRQLINLNAQGSSFKVENSKVIPLLKDKFTGFPMLYLDRNSKLTEIDNGIELTHRLLVNGVLKGYKAELPTGNKENYAYNDLLVVSYWFKPINYIVRSIQGKVSISGKRGHKLSDLPEIEMTDAKDTKGKERTSSKSVEKEEVDKMQMNFADLDFLDLMEIVDDDKGLIVRLSGEDYKVTTPTNVRTGDEFTYIKNAEVGMPKIDYGEDKINATVTFKKYGYLQVPELQLKVDAFTWSAKSVFTNGLNNMHTLGVGVSSEASAKIKSMLGTSLIAEALPNADELRAVTSRNELEFFKVNCSKLPIMSVTKANTIMSSNTIESLIGNVEGVAKVKQQIALAKGYIKEIQNFLGEARLIEMSRANSTLYPAYQKYPAPVLQVLSTLGINVYRGEYMNKQELDATEQEAYNSKPTIIEESKVRIFAIKVDGVNNVKAADIEAVLEGKKKSSKVTESVIASYQEISKMQGNQDEEALSNLIKYKEEKERELKQLKTDIWLYKMAWLTSDNGTLNLRGQWQEKETKATKYRVLQNIENPHIVIQINNIPFLG